VSQDKYFAPLGVLKEPNGSPEPTPDPRERFLIGSPVVRGDRSYRAWMTYHASARNSIQFGYRRSAVATDFIPGGGNINDAAISANWLQRNVNAFCASPVRSMELFDTRTKAPDQLDIVSGDHFRSEVLEMPPLTPVIRPEMHLTRLSARFCITQQFTFIICHQEERGKCEM
jgi:hypothetical protein